MIPQLTPVQLFLMAQILLDPLHLLLHPLLLSPQKEFPLYSLPLAILLVTILLFKVLLLITFLFPYLLKLSPLGPPLLPLLPITTSPHFPFSYNSFPQVSPIIFPGIPTDYSHFRATLTGLNSTFPNATPPPPYPSKFQFTTGPKPSRGLVISSRDAYSGRGRAIRGRGYKITSSTSCQTSPILNFFWPDYQSNSTPSGDASTSNVLNLALMPRVSNHCPPNPPWIPFQYDFFTGLRATSPVVTFHCPSSLTQRSFSFVHSLNFT